MPEFDGEWAIITGATSGIGYQMAKLLSAMGQNMILVCHDEEKLYKVARELNEVSDIIIMPVDLTKDGSFNLVSNECQRLGLKISVLFNFTC